jgi:hypothetical protein
VAIFARDLSPALTGLVKKVDAINEENKSKRMGSFVVMLSDDDKATEKKLKELAEKEKLKKIVLTIDNPAGPEGYEIAKDADVTVVMYTKRKVVKTFAFAKDKLDDAAVKAITESVGSDLLK